jgi:uncharacterized protein (TIGR03000 family)
MIYSQRWLGTSLALILTPALASAQPGITASAQITNGNTASASIVGAMPFRGPVNPYASGVAYPNAFGVGGIAYPFGGFFPFGGYGGGNVVTINVGPGGAPGYDPNQALLQSIPSLTVPYYPKRQLNTIGSTTKPTTRAIPDAAVLTVEVPEDAVVYLQGQKMTSRGTSRQYFSPQLEAGRQYTYHLRAVWTVDGKPIERSMDVPVKAGDTPRVAFLAEEGQARALWLDGSSR